MSPALCTNNCLCAGSIQYSIHINEISFDELLCVKYQTEAGEMNAYSEINATGASKYVIV